MRPLQLIVPVLVIFKGTDTTNTNIHKLSACWGSAIAAVHCQSVNPFKHHWLLPKFDHLPIAIRTKQGLVLYKHLAFIEVPAFVVYYSKL